MTSQYDQWIDLDSRYFVGTGRLKMELMEQEVSVGTVCFDPGCRNNWHSHPVSQTLIVTEGLGFYQELNQPTQVLKPGDTIYIGKDIVHWHGATSTTPLTHLAITSTDETGANVTWLQPVTDDEYVAAHAALEGDKTAPAPVTTGRDALGEFAPTFASLNDDVLFGQIWSRTTELSARDRSVITIISLMASGMIDSSFAFHLTKGRENGITQSEIAEIITHAAFYVGWPKAWAAFRHAQEVWK